MSPSTMSVSTSVPRPRAPPHVEIECHALLSQAQASQPHPSPAVGAGHAILLTQPLSQGTNPPISACQGCRPRHPAHAAPQPAPQPTHSPLPWVQATPSCSHSPSASTPTHPFPLAVRAGNAIQLTRDFSVVYAVEISKRRADMAANNARVYGVDSKVEVRAAAGRQGGGADRGDAAAAVRCLSYVWCAHGWVERGLAMAWRAAQEGGQGGQWSEAAGSWVRCSAGQNRQHCSAPIACSLLI